ncbi:MAG: DNA polymerase III subunit delta [Anaerolineales bacterium]
MARSLPVVYLFYGDDELAQGEALDQMRRKLGDSSAADLNLVQFSGTTVDLEELAAAAQTLPFLAPRRILAVHHAQDLPRHTGWDVRLREMVLGAPPTTALVLLETFDFLEARRRGRRGANESSEDVHRAKSPLGKWSLALGDRVLSKAFEIPRGGAFLRWLHTRASHLGGAIEEDATMALAEFVDGDPRLADQELAKLLDFVNRERPIQRADVERLTPFHAQSDVFALVDSLGARDPRRAIGHLHALLQDEDAQFALHMIARQVRLLIQAREASDRNEEPQGSAGRLPAFVQAKLRGQAANFRMAELESLHRRLVDLDLAVKSSRVELSIGLDALIAEWGRA